MADSKECAERDDLMADAAHCANVFWQLANRLHYDMTRNPDGMVNLSASVANVRKHLDALESAVKEYSAHRERHGCEVSEAVANDPVKD